MIAQCQTTVGLGARIDFAAVMNLWGVCVLEGGGVALASHTYLCDSL
jgi:hypothetical protein